MKQLVVIDLNTNFRNKEVKYNTLASKLQGRHKDFRNGTIKECYLIWSDNGNVKIVQFTKDDFTIEEKLLTRTLKNKIQKRLQE